MSETEQRRRDAAAVVEEYYATSLGDGLPVLPVTTEQVDAFVAAAGAQPDEPLGAVPPGNAEAAVRHVAANAVLAGCLPRHAPVVLAAVRAMLVPEFALYGIACSTKGAAPLVIVNGPARIAAGVHAGGNVFGHGVRGNAVIGRALRLFVQNVGHARPEELDRATLGHPGKFSYCIAEDEEASPWPPLHVRRGCPADRSAVTVVGCEAPRQVSVTQQDGELVLLSLAQALATTGAGRLGRAGAPHVLVIAGEHRDVLASEGWSADDVTRFVAEHAVVPDLIARRLPDPGAAGASVVDDPSDVLLVAAGGTAGRFSSVLPGWTYQSQPVTLEIP